MKEIHVDADPNDVLSLVGSDGDLVDFIPAHTGIIRTNTPGVYQDLVTRYEGGSGAAGSGCASCAYDAMGNPLAVTDPAGLHHPLRPQRIGRGLSHDQPAALQLPRGNAISTPTATSIRVDTEDLQPAFDSADPSSAAYAQFTPSGSGNTAHVPMQPGPGGSVRPGWFTNLYQLRSPGQQDPGGHRRHRFHARPTW